MRLARKGSFRLWDRRACVLVFVCIQDIRLLLPELAHYLLPPLFVTKVERGSRYCAMVV
jgi:hypothetical protein